MTDVIDQVIYLGVLVALIWFALLISADRRKRAPKPSYDVANPRCVVLLQCIEVCEHCNQRLGSRHLSDCPYTTTTNEWWLVDEKT